MRTEKLNTTLASLFGELADLLEFLGENHFKVLAYRRAAETLENIEDAELKAAARLGSLSTFPHIGEAIAKKIDEFVETGRIHKLDDVRALVPDGVRRMIRELPVAPKRVACIYKALGIENIEALKDAVRDSKLGDVLDLGKTNREKIEQFFGLLKQKS